MKVRVLKSAGETGFRAIGSVYEVPTMRAKLMVKAGLVESAEKPAPEPPKPKRKAPAKKKPVAKKTTAKS